MVKIYLTAVALRNPDELSSYEACGTISGITQ